MSAFIDTNILVYAQQAGPKGERARQVLAEGGLLSVQVLNEFVAVSRRKLGKSWDEIDAAMSDILALVGDPIPVSLQTNAAARRLAAVHGLSFYDALIVASAIESGCSALWTEDMQEGRVFGDLRLANPFAGES